MLIEEQIESKNDSLKSLLRHPYVTEKHCLTELRQDRLRVEGLTNLIESAESELKRIAAKYLDQHFQEINREEWINGHLG